MPWPNSTKNWCRGPKTDRAVKKRLLITLTFPPDTGGMQSFAYQRCLRAGDAPVVLAPWHPNCDVFDVAQPFPILRWRPVARNMCGMKRVGQLIQPLLLGHLLLRRGGFDAIECWQPLPLGLIGGLLKRIHRLPLIVWSHGSDLLRVQRVPAGRQVLCWTLSQADRLIANSRATKRQMERLGQGPARIQVITPPVEHERFHPEVDPTTVRLRRGLGRVPTILTVARLVEKKGVDTVLQALPFVLNGFPDVKYLVVGDGPLRRKLQALADELGVAEHVVFVGAVDHSSPELPGYYSACDVYVMPSRTLPDQGEVESFGISYLEAGACGKPVVAGRGGGTAEAIEDGVTGLLVDPWDPEDVAQAIIRLLEDRELAQRLGMAGRQRALREPAWEHLRLD